MVDDYLCNDTRCTFEAIAYSQPEHQLAAAECLREFPQQQVITVPKPDFVIVSVVNPISGKSFLIPVGEVTKADDIPLYASEKQPSMGDALR